MFFDSWRAILVKMESYRSRLTSRRRLHQPALVLTQVDPELACLEHQYQVVCRVQLPLTVYLRQLWPFAIWWNRNLLLANLLRLPRFVKQNLVFLLSAWLLCVAALVWHRCSIMSGMHHRHSGYRFCSLVGFANDSMGRALLMISAYWYNFRK